MTRRTRLALGALAIIASASLVSCAPARVQIVAPPFALTTAEVVYPTGEAYPVNLIFAAADDDPIWTELTGVELPGDASVGPGEFEIIRGEGSDGYDLGNISFEITPSSEGISFESVGLVFADTAEPVRVDVGSWSLASAEPGEFATDDVGAAVAAMTACTTADFPVPASARSVESFDTGVADVEVADLVLHPESAAVTVTLSCDDDADFHIISPSLDYLDGDGVARSTRLTPVAIGFQDIDDGDFERIRAR